MNGVWLALLLAIAASCAASGEPTAGASSPPTRGDTLESLRYQVASRPADPALREQLAAAEAAAGRPGMALEHLQAVERAGQLSESAQAQLAALYWRRYRERALLGDGGARADADAAAGLEGEQGGSALAPAALAEGHFLAALAGFRRGSGPWGRRRAGQALERARALVPDDPRLAVAALAVAPAGAGTSSSSMPMPWVGADAASPAGRSGGASAGGGERALADLGAAGMWLHRNHARRAALDALSSYVALGGREPGPLQAWVIERGWWQGDGASLSLLEAQALIAAGVNLCPISPWPGARGCGQQLWPVAAAALGEALPPPGSAQASDDGASADAAGDAARLADEIWGLAERRLWRTDEAVQVAAWSALALRAWLAEQGASWDELVRARIDIAAVVDDRDLPAFMAPTMLRLAGRPEASARALAALLDAAASGAGGAQAAPSLSTSSPAAQALLLSEAAHQGIALERLRALIDQWPRAAVSGWRSALRRAQAERAHERIGGLWAMAPAVLTSAAARRQRALAWWWRLLARTPHLQRAREQFWARLSAGAQAHGVELSAAAPDLAGAARARGRRPVTAEALIALVVARAADLGDADSEVAVALIEVAEAYAQAPARADRLAAELVAQAPARGRYGPAVAQLFTALGDPERALRWRERVAEESPRHPPYVFALAVAAAAVGASDRALLHFTAAAAASGDAGRAAAGAAANLLQLERALPALGLAQQSQQLTAPGRRGPALAQLIHAAAALGRDRQAASLRQAWLGEVPAMLRADAEAALASVDGDPWRLRGMRAGLVEIGPAPAGPRAAVGSADPATAVDSAALLAYALSAPEDSPAAALATLAVGLEALGLGSDAERLQRASERLPQARVW